MSLHKSLMKFIAMFSVMQSGAFFCVHAAVIQAHVMQKWIWVLWHTHTHTHSTHTLFIEGLYCYSPVNRTGSLQGFSQVQISHKLNTIQNMHTSSWKSIANNEDVGDAVHKNAAKSWTQMRPHCEHVTAEVGSGVLSLRA